MYRTHWFKILVDGMDKRGEGGVKIEVAASLRQRVKDHPKQQHIRELARTGEQIPRKLHRGTSTPISGGHVEQGKDFETLRVGLDKVNTLAAIWVIYVSYPI